MNQTSFIKSPTETMDSLFDTMFLFRMFQNGLIFTALVTGLLNILHVIGCRKKICQNAAILLIVLVTGFINLMIVVYMLQISEITADTYIPRGSTPYCSDYFIPPTFSNTIILLTIVYGLVRQSIRPASAACVVWTLTFGCVLTGLVIVTYMTYSGEPSPQDGSFLTLGSTDTFHLDIFWSVCQTNVEDNTPRFLVEYGLIYLPILLAVLLAWKSSYENTSDSSFLKLKVMESNCCPEDRCVCSQFSKTFVVVLCYSCLLLFVLRPLMIVWTAATDGYFRDIMPSLLQTVLYCFVCSEYVIKLYSMKFSHEARRLPLTKVSNKVMFV